METACWSLTLAAGFDCQLAATLGVVRDSAIVPVDRKVSTAYDKPGPTWEGQHAMNSLGYRLMSQGAAERTG